MSIVQKWNALLQEEQKINLVIQERMREIYRHFNSKMKNAFDEKATALPSASKPYIKVCFSYRASKEIKKILLANPLLIGDTKYILAEQFPLKWLDEDYKQDIDDWFALVQLKDIL